MDKPKAPDLFKISPADLMVFTIPFLSEFAFTDIGEAIKIAETLRNAKTMQKVNYDWNKLGSGYKYLVKEKRYTYTGDSDFSVRTEYVYSKELYAKIYDFAVQNKMMEEQAQKDKKEYEVQQEQASSIISDIRGRVTKVNAKYKRLYNLTHKFATDYYHLSDNNEEMAIKFMAKAYSLTDEERAYILANYIENLPKTTEE